jgi:hypothetical protein
VIFGGAPGPKPFKILEARGALAYPQTKMYNIRFFAVAVAVCSRCGSSSCTQRSSEAAKAAAMAAPYRRRRGEGAGARNVRWCGRVARIAAGAAWRSRKSTVYRSGRALPSVGHFVSCHPDSRLHKCGRILYIDDLLHRAGQSALTRRSAPRPAGVAASAASGPSLATPGRRMLVLYQLAWRET